MDPPAFAIPIDKDTSRSDTKSKVPEHHAYPKLELPRPLFALVIGIDKYLNYRELRGAVKDANDVVDLLMNCMDVPEGRITKLLDQAATADAIIGGIRSLTYNADIMRGDPVFIYFAGHGARAIVPQGWETTDGRVETICPVDLSADDIGENTVSGIPDVVLNALITELADKKGDNITVIFDCCHSVSGLRRDDRATNIRGINNLPPLSADWGKTLASEKSGSSKSLNLRSLECSVLLAACGKLEEAGETYQGGLFTQRLLDHIRELSSDKLKKLTYKDLIRPLILSNSQHPQCEGSKPHRYLFRSEMADQCFIPGRRDRQGNLVLDVGQLLGIERGTEFDIYSKDIISSDNPSHGCLKVDSISKDRSILSFAGGAEFAVPNPFFAIQTCFSEDQKIRVYCSDSKKLNEVLLLHERGFSGFAILVNASENADLIVSFSDSIEGENRKECLGNNHQCICFDWAGHNVISQQSHSRIGRPIPLDNTKKIIQVFWAAAKFQYYLHHGQDDPRNDQIKMALRLLSTKDEKIQGVWIRKRTPIGPDILVKDPAEIQLEKNKPVGPFGLTISNYSKEDLLPQVFWFEGRNLSITPWYLSQYGADSSGIKNAVDASLRASRGPGQPGEFHVGYGEIHNAPWGFSDVGAGKIVGFFKVFLTNFNVNFKFLAQKSPFDEIDARIALRRKYEEVDWLASKRVTVVQLPP